MHSKDSKVNNTSSCELSRDGDYIVKQFTILGYNKKFKPQRSLFVTIADKVNVNTTNEEQKPQAINTKPDPIFAFHESKSQIHRPSLSRTISMNHKSQFGKKDITSVDKKSTIINLKKESPRQKVIVMKEFEEKKVSKETELFNRIYNVDEEFKHRLGQIKKLKSNFSLIEYQHLIIDLMNDHMGTDHLKKLSHKLREVRDVSQKVRTSTPINWDDVLDEKRIYEEKKYVLHHRKDSSISLKSMISDIKNHEQKNSKMKLKSESDLLAHLKTDTEGTKRKPKGLSRRATKLQYMANFMPPYILDKLQNL
jgi:hypothetical protein